MSNNNRELLESLVKGSKATYINGILMWLPPRGGAILSGKKQKGDGSQKEGQEPLMRIKSPIYIKGTSASPWFVEDNKDGINFMEGSEGSVMENVHFLNSGEDCITIYSGKLKILKCSFMGDSNSDKCIQANYADGLEVINCIFNNFITGVQCGLRKYAKSSNKSFITSCRFTNVDAPIKAVVGTVIVKNCKYSNAKTGNVEDSGGKIKEN